MIFVTGGTGFLGGYVLAELLSNHHRKVFVLTRAKSEAQADEKLWRTLQLHMSPEAFRRHRPSIVPIAGDLHAPGLGMSPEHRALVRKSATSVLHIAASLNRKSAKECLNSNLRGTLSVINLARELDDLQRFSHVSTVAVAGKRANQVVLEDEAIDWDWSDFDPYGRTKKFCEHMVRELLPDVKKTFFRPSIVLGDSRSPKTSQFDMLRALCIFARMRMIPVAADTRLDIVNADFVGMAIAKLHLADAAHEIYHLSGGRNTVTAAEIATCFRRSGYPRARFAPRLGKPFAKAVSALDRLPGRHPIRLGAALIKVFWPYITWNVVFDNTRAVLETGKEPARFTEYGAPLSLWAEENGFRYPYEALPPHEPVLARTA